MLNFCTKPFFVFFFWTLLQTFCFPSVWLSKLSIIFTKSWTFSCWPFWKDQNVMHVIDTEVHQKHWPKTKGKSMLQWTGPVTIPFPETQRSYFHRNDLLFCNFLLRFFCCWSIWDPGNRIVTYLYKMLPFFKSTANVTARLHVFYLCYFFNLKFTKWSESFCFAYKRKESSYSFLIWLNCSLWSNLICFV